MLCLSGIGAAMAAFLVAPAGAASAEPSIRVVPRSTPAGQRVSVIGVDYCAGGGCSLVTVTLSQRVLAEGVAVQPDGTFNVPVRINEPEGEHEVVATQSTPAGILRATATVIVASLDTVPGTMVPGTPSTAKPPEVTTTTTAAGTVAPPSTVPTTTVTSAAPLSAAGGDDANDDPWWLALLAVVAAAAAVGAALFVGRARRRRHLPEA